MAAEVHVGDVGTIFQSVLKDQDGSIVDCSGATLMEMVFIKPSSGYRLVKPASFLTDGKDGNIVTVSNFGDIDQVGIWKRQAHIEFGNNDFHSDISTFQVLPNL